MKKRQWWKVMLVVLTASISGVMFIGVKTYQGAPPIPDFKDPAGRVVVSRDSVLRGQELFQRYALMEYGTMFGDGGGRGPDFTAEALHVLAASMTDYYADRLESNLSDRTVEQRRAMVQGRVAEEIKANQYQAADQSVALNDAQVFAIDQIRAHYAKVFTGSDRESFKPARYIDNAEDIKDLSHFFYWGAWVCGAARPGCNYSYTHNWPYDPVAGNLPTAGIMTWSVLGALALIAVLGIVLYGYGRLEPISNKIATNDLAPVATNEGVTNFEPSPTQRASYKFFALAAVLFFVQVLAGVLTVHDFLGFTTFFGVDISKALPITIVRSWHVILSVVWISACWIGATIFILPLICRPEPQGQLRWVNALFALLVTIVCGSAIGIFLGPKGFLGDWWQALGHQGWEFVELGKIWQWLLYGSFIMWGVIIFRGVRPALKIKDPWSMPYWLIYAIGAIVLLFTSGFVATSKTNFAIADFWRWCVIHMWVEAFFEVFTTILVGYFLYIMGLVSGQMAVRVVYLATILFLGSGILGISHNFYWNAKSLETVAVGSVFSTLQVIPLILLTLEAWRFRHLPQRMLRQNGNESAGGFGLADAFLFLIAVNFWNFLGAGVFGFIINLPVVNYFEHGTYLTVNHGHAALMGVYGNLAIAAMLFCGRFLVSASRWNSALIRFSFWSLNLGLGLMLILDLFPAGIVQLHTVIEKGLWFARSQEFVQGEFFQTATWMRVIGGSMFFWGGVIPLAWFMITRLRDLKPAQVQDEKAVFVADSSVLAAVVNGVHFERVPSKF